MNTDSKMGGLISLPGNLSSPRDAKASDFPAVGPMGKAGEASGAMQLVKQTMTQEGCQHTQDSGSGTPSVWGKADFPVGKSMGEGANQTSMSYDCAVSFSTGQIVPNVADKR